MGRIRGVLVSPEKFSALREQLGLTQEELGQLLNVHSGTIRRIEHPRGTRVDKSTLRTMAERLTGSGKLSITYDQLVARIGGTNGHVRPVVEDVDKLARKWVKLLSEFTMHTPRDVQRKALAAWDPEEVGKLIELLKSAAGPTPAQKGFDPDRPLRSTVIDASGKKTTQVEKMGKASRRARTA